MISLLFLFGLAKIHEVYSFSSQRLILVSIDGLRYDFVPRLAKQAPFLNTILSHAASVEFVKNVFPTDTSPNHRSLVTGLYPEKHGIVGNQMYDVMENKTFDMDESDTFWWNWAEPIWVTNKRQGGRSGLMYYPGYNVHYAGLDSDYNVEDFSSKNPLASKKDVMPLPLRVDVILRWLADDPNLNFIALYAEVLDFTSHEVTADLETETATAKRSEALAALGDMLYRLWRGLIELKLDASVNIIITGDHGHVTVNYTQMIDINAYLDSEKCIEHAFGRTSVYLYPKTGFEDYVYHSLKGKHPNMTVYLKTEIPESFHIKHCNRTAPILLLADPGWLIQVQMVSFLKGKFVRGEHGYSNELREMNPGFFAWGPGFRPGARQTSIEIVDIYPAMCFLLNLTTPNNDGDFARIKPLLFQ